MAVATIPAFKPIRADPNQYVYELAWLPLRVRQFSLEFHPASFVEAHLYTSQDNFLKTCRDSHVMPVCVQFDYSHDAKAFEQKDIGCIANISTPEEKQAAEALTIQGGRYHTLKFYAREYAAEGFNVFTRRSLIDLHNGNFYLFNGFVDLTPSDVDRHVAQVKMSRPKGIELFVHELARVKDRKVLERWYDKMAEKYSR